jgi:hypothetical protein
MADPLDVVAARIARIALTEVPSLGRVGPGPVLTVVRNTQTGKIYVGLNTGVPKQLSDAKPSWISTGGSGKAKSSSSGPIPRPLVVTRKSMP